MNTVLYILLAHFIADFVQQSHSMAMNKSKSFLWLAAHVGVYTATMGVFSVMLFDTSHSWFLFTTITGVLHLAVDFVTSKINKHLWASGNTHNFFVGVGADQYVHHTCLLILYRVLQ